MNKLPKTYIEKLVSNADTISPERKEELIGLKELILEQIKNKDKAQINFICTHNSRRSQLSELWLRAACAFYNIKNVFSFSGGTEGTAFNHRMVQAIQTKGFPLEKLSVNANPIYNLNITSRNPLMFSKVYNDENNPSKDFIAVMVCDHAEQNCPIVYGADSRYSLKYVDPKFADDTDEEKPVYLAKVDEIGTEILFLAAQLGS